MSPPSNPIIASLAAVNTLAAGACGKSLIASAYAFTAAAFVLIFSVSNVYAWNFNILSNGFSAPKNPAIAPPTAPTAAPIPPIP